MSWDKHTLQELREKLVERTSVSEEEAELLKRKANIVEKFMEENLSYESVFLGHENEILNLDLDIDVEEEGFIDDDTEPQDENKEPAMRYAGPGWNDYVMSLFQEHELVDGKPRIAGLRRLVENLLGEILFSGVVDYKVHFPQDALEPGRAVVNYEVVIHFAIDYPQYISEGDILSNSRHARTFRGLAGAYLGNTDDGFSVYCEAIAETRAEARALKKALQLETVTFEELTSKDTKATVTDFLNSRQKTVTGERNETDLIQVQQMYIVQTKCEQLKIEPENVCQEHLGKSFTNKLTRQEGTELIGYINAKYQTGGSK